MSKGQVNGKKIREQEFYNTLRVFTAAGVCFLLAFILPPKYMTYVLIFSAGILLFSPLWLLLSKKVLCVLTEDRLYYYGMEFAVVSGKKRTVLSDVGSVSLTDITDYEYLPGTRRSKSFSVPSRVILYGTDFELTISGGGKHLIRQLEKAQMACIGRDSAKPSSPDAPAALRVRRGLWKEIWHSFESGELEDVLSRYTIRLMEGDESLDVIDIAVEHNGHEITFNIDETSIYLYAVDAQRTQTVTFDQLSDLEAFFSAIREFIAVNS